MGLSWNFFLSILSSNPACSPAEEILEDIRAQIIVALDGYQPEALPVILRFILQSGVGTRK